MRELMPDFLIIGAGKSGTTSLYNHLRGHPEIYMPEFKEPRYFSSDGISGIKPAVRSKSEYLALFEAGRAATMRGEASVSYLVDPESPKRIYDALGGKVKLLVLLRNPALRMYSHWVQNHRRELDDTPVKEALLGSFSATDWVPERWHLGYAKMSLYAEQLARYFSVFGRNQIQVTIFEEAITEMEGYLRKTCQFLGVSPNYKFSVSSVHNKGHLFRFQILNRFVYDYYGRYLASTATRITPKKIRNWAKQRIVSWNKKDAPVMNDIVRGQLEECLAPSVRELESLLGRDLSQVWF